MAVAVGVMITFGGGLYASDAAAARGGTKHPSGHGPSRAGSVRVYSGAAKMSGRGAARHASIRKGGKSMSYGYAAPAYAYAPTSYGNTSYGNASYGTGYGSSSYGERGMSCVPFARENSGIEVAGNAGTWWNNAAGVYERGFRPEAGSVLNFRSTGRMHMGHVAVVTNVLSARTIEIDHANWSGRGRISRGVVVADVSPSNDWTAVRVSLGRGAEFGSVYPTYGFIYDRPDHGTLVANNGAVSGSSLVRQVALRSPVADQPVEVAEAPDDMPAPRAGRTVSRRRVVAVHRHVRHRH